MNSLEENITPYEIKKRYDEIKKTLDKLNDKTIANNNIYVLFSKYFGKEQNWNQKDSVKRYFIDIKLISKYENERIKRIPDSILEASGRFFLI
jgi:isopropylmalate/homocitrate/citramalate synthase